MDKQKNQAHHVFTGDFLAEVECQLSIIGFVLRQQCDPDIPRTYFPSGYLPNASAKDDNTMGGNGTRNEGCFTGGIIVHVELLEPRTIGE